MRPMGLSGDLAWWRDRREAPDLDRAEAQEVLARLRAWKVQHDDDRALQANPFFQMVWDGVFSDDDDAVVEAIGEIEAALAPS